MKNLFLEMLSISFTAILLLGCSASSGTIRYSGSNDPDSLDKIVSLNQDLEEGSNTHTFTKQVVIDTAEFGPEFDFIDPGDMPEENDRVDLSEILNKYHSGNSPNSEVVTLVNSNKEKLLMSIIEYLDTPYKYGGNSKKGIDCSAFTQTIYQNTISVSLLRSARDQFTQGISINNRDDLKFGDLVFFDTRKRVKPGHVGIYIGDNLFAHASTKHGVIISSLDHSYYSKRFMGGRRIADNNAF
ncbi:MAG: C40 family peptidase [Ignavibacteriaceae bacterium]|nr:C40 family peptidase [Ignavibacteriaceae bacterium]